MTKAKHPVGDRRHEQRRARMHRRQLNRHRKNPCPHAPATIALEDMVGEYEEHPGRKRHNRWTANLRWPETQVDTDGLPLIVRRYDVVVEYSGDEVYWYFHDRFTVPAKDDLIDSNLTAHLRLHDIHASLNYRYKVRAVSRACKGEWSDWFDLGLADDAPDTPVDVQIDRAPHGIRTTWNYPSDSEDEDIFENRAAYFIAEIWTNDDFGPVEQFTATAADNYLLINAHGFDDGDVCMVSFDPTAGDNLPNPLKRWKRYYITDASTNVFRLSRNPDGSPVVDLTTDGAGQLHWGMVDKERHIHKHAVKFRIDTEDFDEDTLFYTRVRAAADNRAKSDWVPATKDGNDDPEGTPEGRRPAWLRRVFTATIQGSVGEGLYVLPQRIDDAYRIRRVTCAFHRAPDAGDAYFDVKINGAVYVFDQDDTKMLKLNDGDKDATTKQMVNRTLERGDHIRIQGYDMPATPPQNGTIQIICDRVRDGNTADSGGGGGE